MEDKITIIMNHGAMGASEDDDTMETFIRKLSVKYGEENSRPEKYGANYEDNNIKITPYCRCDEDDCKLCDSDNMTVEGANFYLKKTGLACKRYKYIGRGMEYNRGITTEDYQECINLLKD